MDKILDCVPYYDLEIDIDDIEKGCLLLLPKVRPQWNTEDIKFKSFKAGYVNKVIGCYVNGFKDATVVRVFGTRDDLGFDRKKEILIGKTLSEHGIAPEIYCIFKNGICTKYIEGQQYTWETESWKQLQNDEIAWTAMAKSIAKLHSTAVRETLVKYGVEISKRSHLLEIIEQGVQNLPYETEDKEKKKRMKEELPGKEQWEAEAKFLIQEVQSSNIKLPFGNLDCNQTNLVYNREEDKAFIVDLDLSGTNFNMYDVCSNIAGMWWGVDVNPKVLLPDKEWQMKYIKIYLETLARLENDETEITDDSIKESYEQVQFCYLLYQFFLATFIFSNSWNETPFFEFADDITWARGRINMYFKLKKQIYSNDDFKKYFLGRKKTN